MSITFIKQDLLKVNEIFNCNGHVILHVGNCKGKMNLGLAKSIRSKWPQVYRDYKTKEEESRLLLCDVVVSDITETLTVYTLLAQATYGYSGIHLNYVALRDCLNKVVILETNRLKNEDTSLRKIYLPKFMGCGLAGGDWVEVGDIVEETLSPFFDVFICSI